MKLLNKIYKVACGVALLSAVSSCSSDWMDVTPTNGVPAETALSSLSALESARVGMYKSFKGISDMVDYYGRQMFVYGDVRGEDLQYDAENGSSRGEFYYFMEFRTADDFTSSTAIWQSPFVVIGRANRIIAAADNNSIADAADTHVAFHFLDVFFKLGSERRIFDAVDISLKAFILAVGSHTAAACAEV